MNSSEKTLIIIKNLEFFSLILCIFSIPLFESPKNIFLSVSFIFFLLRHYFEKDLKEAFLTQDVRIGFLLLASSALVSSFFSSHLSLGLQGFLDFIKIYVIFLITKDFLDNKSLIIIISSIFISSTFAVLLAGYDFFSGQKVYFELKSVGHFNHSSIYLALSLMLSFSLFVNSYKFSFPWILLIAQNLITFTAIVIAGSRATLSSIIISLLAFAFYQKRKKLLIIFVIMLTIIISLLFLLPSQSNLLLSKKKISFSDPSFRERLNIWTDAFNMWFSNPFLGVGPKQFKFYSYSQNGTHAHNIYLNTLAQLGIIGLAALLYLFYLIISELKRSDRENPLWYAVLLSFIIVLVNGILNTTLHSEHGLIFSIICAIGLTKRQ